MASPIADIARALSENGVLTRTGKHVWDRSTVWAMLRNPAYHGQAAFGKTQTTGQRAKPTRPSRRRQLRVDQLRHSQAAAQLARHSQSSVRRQRWIIRAELDPSGPCQG